MSPSVRAVATVVCRSGKLSTSTPRKLRGFRGFRHASSSVRSAECKGGVCPCLRLSCSRSHSQIWKTVHFDTPKTFVISVVLGMHRVRFAVPSVKVVLLCPCLPPSCSRSRSQIWKSSTSTPPKLRGFRGFRHASSSPCSTECEGGVHLCLPLF